MDMNLKKTAPDKRLGKFILAAVTRTGHAARSAWLRTWYGLAWRIGRGTRFAGSVHRRSLGGNAVFGRNCDLGPGLVIDVATGGELIVGNNVSINGGSYISVRDRLEIGNDTRIGEYCSIRDNDHLFETADIPVRCQGMQTGPVTLGQDVWIGRGAVIQPGVRIGDGAVIGANSFVNSDIPAYSVAVGTPAKVIKQRGSA